MTKERFSISWELATSAEVSAILAILAQNKAVTFSVNEENLNIPSTSVIMFLGSIEYSTLGSGYYASLSLELEAVL